MEICGVGSGWHSLPPVWPRDWLYWFHSMALGVGVEPGLNLHPISLSSIFKALAVMAVLFCE